MVEKDDGRERRCGRMVEKERMVERGGLIGWWRKRGW
jgi:hypothetical protein